MAVFKRGGVWWYEFISLAEPLVTPLPDDVSFAAGATLGIPAMTA